MSEQGQGGGSSTSSATSNEQDAPVASNSTEDARKVLLTEDELKNLSAEALVKHCRLQQSHQASLEQQLKQQEGELLQVRENFERTRTQLGELQQREKMLVRRLAAKEQEMQDYVCQVNELKPPQTTLRSTLLDPAVNSLLQMLRGELQSTKAKLEETQNDLSAWKFTPDSNTGKRLMAKCRQLHQENEELGKITSSGRIAILEGDLALQKKFSEEVRQSQLELDSFLADLDEDVEGMQSTILLLQQELRKTKDQVGELQKENGSLKAAAVVNVNGTTTTTSSAVSAVNNVDEEDIERDIIDNDDNEAGINHNNKRVNGDSSSSSSSTSVCCAEDRTDERTTRVHNNKRVRRSSVLSIDYNDEDALIVNNTNGDANAISD